MAKYVIGLVGQQGSGKGTAAKIMQKRYGAEVYRFSTVLRDIANRLGIEQSRDNLVNLSEILRRGFGEDVLAFALERDAVNSRSDLVVVDGVRRIGDLAALEPLEQFKLVVITAEPDIRYQRMLKRGENKGETRMTFEEFLKVEKQAPTEVTIPEVAARAWKTIDNNGTREELEAKIDQVMVELGIKPATA